MSSVRHYHHHYHFSYKTSLRRHFTAVAIVIVILSIVLLYVMHSISPHNPTNFKQVSFFQILFATYNTLLRMLVAYALAMLLSIPLALFITSAPKVEKVMLPLFDILQSVPVLAFFPVIVLSFVKFNFLEGAAIFILVVAMMGSLVFSMIGGLKAIPEDINSAAFVFNATGFRKLIYITIPAMFPEIMTGSLLAWSQGWSILIIAEALHTYIPHGTAANDLFGLGSLLVDAFAGGQNSVFLTALATMIVVISLLNYFVWQKLLHFAERFKFD